MGLKSAPQDKMILAKLPDTDCPVVLHFASYEHEDGNWSGWVWSDELFQDACDPLGAEECDDIQWALIPE
jgi:hypothetical protein